MNIANSRTRPFDLRLILRRIPPAALMMSLILFALFFFEIFNFSTTDYALSDLLGSLTFAGLQWSTILAIAFCSIDFAGIARLFTPDADRSEPRETWYLLGAWMIAATMNAALTWWGVSMAIMNHAVQSTSVVSQSTLIGVVPVFVAIMVWVIRILIIGSISYAANRFFQQDKRQTNSSMVRPHPQSSPLNTVSRPISASSRTPSHHTISGTTSRSQTRSEPSYHTLNASSHRGESVSIQDPSSSEAQRM